MSKTKTAADKRAEADAAKAKATAEQNEADAAKAKADAEQAEADAARAAAEKAEADAARAPKAAKPKTVPMSRPHDDGYNGPTQADVHESEVANWAALGWTKRG